MATREPFLINPPRRRRRKRRAVSGKRKTSVRRKRRNPAKKLAITRRKKHRPVLYGSGKVWKRSSRSRSKQRGVRLNPGLAVIGGYNPMRKRRSYRRRRNQPRTIRGFVSTFQKTLPLALTGIASSVVTNMVPGIFSGMIVQAGPMAGKWVNYGIKSAVALIGGPMVGQMVGKDHGNVWTIVGITVVVSDLIRDFMPGVIPGLGYMDYHDEYGYAGEGAGAFPEEVGAFPEEVSEYGDAMGQVDQAWPYSGAHEYGY